MATARAETAPRHPDPALRTRVYHATAAEVRAACAEAAEETGWRARGAGADGGAGAPDAAFSATRRRLLPPSRAALEARLERLAGDVVRVDARAEVASPLPTLGQEARVLRAFLWAVDARVPQASDTPLRQKGL